MRPLLDLVSVGSAGKTKRGKSAAAGNPSSVCQGEELQAWGSREGFCLGAVSSTDTHLITCVEANRTALRQRLSHPTESHITQ